MERKFANRIRSQSTNISVHATCLQGYGAGDDVSLSNNMQMETAFPEWAAHQNTIYASNMNAINNPMASG